MSKTPRYHDKKYPHTICFQLSADQLKRIDWKAGDKGRSAVLRKLIDQNL